MTERRGLWRAGAVACLLLAWGLLLWRLNDVPPGFQHDQMFDAQDALDVLAGRGQLYFPANFGREPLFMYSAAAVLAGTGNHVVWGLRFAGVLWAALGLAVTLALARRYVPWPYALATGAGMAGSFWFLFAGRLGLEPVPLIALAMAMVYWLDRACADVVRCGRASWLAFAAAGLCGGAAVYTYLAGRALYGLVPLLLACEAWLAVGARRGPGRPPTRRVWPGLMLAGGVMLAVSAPLLFYVAAHPDLADRRVGELGQSLAAARLGDLSGILGSIRETVLAVLWAGPPALPYHYNLPGRPALGPIAALLLLPGLIIGLAGAAGRRVGGAYAGVPGQSRDAAGLALVGDQAPAAGRRHEFLLLAALLLGLAPPLLSSADALYVRGIIALPLLSIYAGRGLWFVCARLLRPLFGRRRGYAVIVSTVVALLLAGHLAESAQAYFVRWAQAEPVQRIYNADWRAAAAYLDAHPVEGQVFAGTDRLQDLDRQTYLLYSPSRRDVRWFQLAASTPLPGHGDALYLLAGSITELPADLAVISGTLRAPLTIASDSGAYPLLRGFWLSADDVTRGLRRAGLRPVTPAPVYGDTLQLEAAGLVDHGRELEFLAHWQPLADWPRGGLPPKLSVSLVDSTGYRWAQVDTPTNLPYEAWQPGERYLESVRLPVPADLPPGDYSARLLVYADPTQPLPVQRDGAAVAAAPAVAGITVAARQDRGSPPAPPAPVTGSGAALQPAGLWTSPGILFGGVPAEVRVSWQAQAPLNTGGLHFTVRAVDAGDREQWSVEASPLSPLPAMWPAGQTYRLTHRVTPPIGAPGTAPANLEICALQGSRTLACANAGQSQFVNRAPILALPAPPEYASGASWDARLRLAGYNLVRESQAISLTLYWQVASPPPTTWQRFVHAVDSRGQIAAQVDGVPGDAAIPMPAWRPGEYVIDRVKLDLPAGAAAQAITVGYYDPETGVRVPITLPSGADPASRELELLP